MPSSGVPSPRDADHPIGATQFFDASSAKSMFLAVAGAWLATTNTDFGPVFWCEGAYLDDEIFWSRASQRVMRVGQYSAATRAAWARLSWQRAAGESAVRRSAARVQAPICRVGTA